MLTQANFENPSRLMKRLEFLWKTFYKAQRILQGSVIRCYLFRVQCATTLFIHLLATKSCFLHEKRGIIHTHFLQLSLKKHLRTVSFYMYCHWRYRLRVIAIYTWTLSTGGQGKKKLKHSENKNQKPSTCIFCRIDPFTDMLTSLLKVFSVVGRCHIVSYKSAGMVCKFWYV